MNRTQRCCSCRQSIIGDSFQSHSPRCNLVWENSRRKLEYMEKAHGENMKTPQRKLRAGITSPLLMAVHAAHCVVVCNMGQKQCLFLSFFAFYYIRNHEWKQAKVSKQQAILKSKEITWICSTTQLSAEVAYGLCLPTVCQTQFRLYI